MINGQKKSIESLKPVIGFVPQDDVVNESLTVRENIQFSAIKRMPSGTSESRLEVLEEKGFSMKNRGRRPQAGASYGV